MAFYEYITVISDNQVKCTLCDDVIEDGDLLEAHIYDKKHKELYMKNLMAINSIVIGNTALFCHLCNCDVETSNLTGHVRSETHRSGLSSIKELVSLDGDLIELPTKLSTQYPHCTICDTKVEFTFTTLKHHLSSDVHKHARAMVLQPLNGIFSVEGTNKYLWCKICQRFFDNFVEVIFRHIEETDHAKKMAKLLRLIDNQNIDIDKYLQNLKLDTAYCKKCLINVPCNIDNLQSHIKGKKHKS